MLKKLAANFNIFNIFSRYFCFRWLLVWYKREFTHEKILDLWEVLFTNQPCIDFHLLIGVAILDNEMATFIENEYGFTEILKHVNDLSEKLDLKQVLEHAESIYHQIINSNKLPDRVRVILGMEPIHAYGDDPVNTDDEEEAQLKKEREEKERIDSEEQVKIDNECDNGLAHNFF
jgi:TBC1 domain family member 15